jgi:glucokinase
MKAALVDSSGSVLQSRKTNTPLSLDGMREVLEGLLAEFSGALKPVGCGVACKGIIDPTTTRVECQPGMLHYLEGSVLADLVCEAAAVKMPVFADNDARVALAGECVWGAARGLRNALMFTLGTGVGGGILADGHIVRGHRGVAGHLGHVTVEVDGQPCICGNRGCLETVFSARVIEAAAYSAIHRGLLPAFPHATANPPSCADVFRAADAGDDTARWIVASGNRKLGAAIAGLALALDPEVIIVGGQIAGAGELLFSPLREEVASRTRALLRRELPVIPMQVADPSGVVGAAALVFEERGAQY